MCNDAHPKGPGCLSFFLNVAFIFYLILPVSMGQAMLRTDRQNKEANRYSMRWNVRLTNLWLEQDSNPGPSAWHRQRGKALPTEPLSRSWNVRKMKRRRISYIREGSPPFAQNILSQCKNPDAGNIQDKFSSWSTICCIKFCSVKMFLFILISFLERRTPYAVYLSFPLQQSQKERN